MAGLAFLFLTQLDIIDSWTNVVILLFFWSYFLQLDVNVIINYGKRGKHFKAPPKSPTLVLELRDRVVFKVEVFQHDFYISK